MNSLVINDFPELSFETNEAINQLRINLSFCGANVKTIVITSSVPNEGKSFIALNLWRAIAELGNRVLIVDCDLRNSEMRTKHAISGLDKGSGITYFLAGRLSLNDTVYRTNIPNGYMIPMGTPVTNPAILLEDPLFERMLQECRNTFDYIILDTPPIGSVADALKIAALSDGSVLVIRADDTPRKIVMDSVQQLRRTGKPLLGTVLNRVETNKKSSHYYYYGYGDKYGYGYGYGHKDEGSSKKKR